MEDFNKLYCIWAPQNNRTFPGIWYWSLKTGHFDRREKRQTKAMQVVQSLHKEEASKGGHYFFEKTQSLRKQANEPGHGGAGKISTGARVEFAWGVTAIFAKAPRLRSVTSSLPMLHIWRQRGLSSRGRDAPEGPGPPLSGLQAPRLRSGSPFVRYAHSLRRAANIFPKA